MKKNDNISENNIEDATESERGLGRKTIGREVQRYAFMLLACFCYATSVRMFLIPAHIVGGGVSGAASLVELTAGRNGFWLLQAGAVTIVMNIPILIMGLRIKGLRFIIRCLITTACLGGITDLMSLVPNPLTDTLTEQPLLAAVYGGLLQGVGIGLFIKYEVSSGGTELLGRVTQHYLKVGTIAVHASAFDIIVVLVAAFVLHEPENVLYALILIFICTRLSDMIVVGFNSAKLCYIITDHADEIAGELLRTSPRGITLLHGTGMYTKLPRGVLLTCVKNQQLTQLRRTAKELDENVFIIVCAANEVYGKGFRSV